MKKYFSIDYLQFTTNETPDFIHGEGLLKASPLPFYKHCLEYQCGTRVFVGNVNSDKVLVQMPGKTCARWDMANFAGRIAYELGKGAKFSRIDLAVTVDTLRPLNLFKTALRCDLIVAPRFARDEPKIIVDKTGAVETIYLGSLKKRGRKGIFRAYDKGREQHTNDMITRFELEIRAKRATTAAKRISNGVPIGDIIGKVVAIPGKQWWRDILEHSDNPLPRVERQREPDPIARRWRWLMVQVAPALGALLATDLRGGQANLELFNTEVHAAYLKALQDLDRSK